MARELQEAGRGGDKGQQELYVSSQTTGPRRLRHKILKNEFHDISIIHQFEESKKEKKKRGGRGKWAGIYRLI